MTDNLWKCVHSFPIGILIFCLVACGGGETSRLDKAPLATDITSPDLPAVVNPGGQVGAEPPSTALRRQIEELEQSEKIPKLDRTDTLGGVDANADGVRDDIAAFIAELPLNADQKRAFMQKARALQGTLFVDLNDKIAQQKSGDRTMAATNCTGDKLPEVFHIVGQKLQALTFNTNPRMRRYMQYNAGRSGSVTSMPIGDSCE
jgi:hypothetical protein